MSVYPTIEDEIRRKRQKVIDAQRELDEAIDAEIEALERLRRREDATY